MVKITKPPQEKKFNGKIYSLIEFFPEETTYPGSKDTAQKIAKMYREYSTYLARIASFNLVTIGGKYPIKKTKWFVYVR